jgi:hypothetical protein
VNLPDGRSGREIASCALCADVLEVFPGIARRRSCELGSAFTNRRISMRQKRSVHWLILVLFGAVIGDLWAAPPVPDRLTPETFEAIKARVSLTPDDLAWQQVRWREGFLEGVLEAQAADKPLFFWFYGGGLAGNC